MKLEGFLKKKRLKIKTGMTKKTIFYWELPPKCWIMTTWRQKNSNKVWKIRYSLKKESMNKSQSKIIINWPKIRFIGTKWPEGFLKNQMKNIFDLQSIADKDGLTI